MITRPKILALFILLSILPATNSAVAVEGPKIDPDYEPLTIENPEIPRDELALLVKPLTVEELHAEADAWLGLLQQKTRETSQAELAIRRKSKAIEQAEEVQESLEETREVLDEVKDVYRDAKGSGTAVEQQQNIAVVADGSKLEQTADIVADIAESQMEDKKDILVSFNELKAQRTRLADRLNVVLDELSTKLVSNLEGGENEIVAPYRLYAVAVSDIVVDVSDTQALWSNTVGWMKSEVGGMRLARRMGKFLLTLAVFWILGVMVGKILDKALAMTRITVELMRSVIVRTVRRGIFLIGIIIGLSVIEINVGPILAVVGAAGFVVAFALQNTLSNFASGIMIMIYRPYDVGDVIKVGGVLGRARSMNLVNTTIATFDNQLLIVPNNNIWGDIITNITGSDTRRVDLLFRINYEDDIDTALRVLHEVVEEHPLVLQEPEALIEVQELGEYTVNIICWSWAKTVDYWQVYRDITRRAKERFEAAGMQTPYPKHNIRSLDWSGER